MTGLDRNAAAPAGQSRSPGEATACGERELPPQPAHADNPVHARSSPDVLDRTDTSLILAAALEHMTQGLCFFDGAQKLVLCNRRYAEIYNLPADVTRPGTTLQEIVTRRGEVGSSPSMSPAEYVEWRNALRGSGKQFDSQVTLRNGKTILISHHPMHDEGWVATHDDITHRLRTEEVARQVERMRSIGRLTAGIAHEFNNLFQTIGTVLELVAALEDVARDEQLLASVTDAALAVVNGGRLTQRLLAFSHKQPVRLPRIDVGEFIAANAGLLRQTCRESIVFEIVPEAGQFPVRADIEEFRSALLNLVHNACEAMPAGGILRIGIGNSNLQGSEAEAAGLPDGGYVRVTVSDTGLGIAPADLGLVFDPFFTTKPFGASAGLGLAQVHGAAHQSGGSASIASVPGGGTTVTLLLARATADAESGAEQP